MVPLQLQITLAVEQQPDEEGAAEHGGNDADGDFGPGGGAAGKRVADRQKQSAKQERGGREPAMGYP